MRSVFFHLLGTTRDEVAGLISTLAGQNPPPSDDEWVAPPGLYFRFYDDLVTDDDDGSLLGILEDALGAPPDLTVMVDISGRIPGHAEARKLAEAFLGNYHGVACDDYSDHCWTLEEIRSDAVLGGGNFSTSWEAVGLAGSRRCDCR